MNIDILGISELKWTGMGKFNSDDHYICYCGQESLRINEVALIVNKRVRNAVPECSQNRMIAVSFQGKPFNITVIQIDAPTSNAEDTDVEAETPILWPPDSTSWLIGKDPDAGKDWGQEKRITG